MEISRFFLKRNYQIILEPYLTWNPSRSPRQGRAIVGWLGFQVTIGQQSKSRILINSPKKKKTLLQGLNKYTVCISRNVQKEYTAEKGRKKSRSRKQRHTWETLTELLLIFHRDQHAVLFNIVCWTVTYRCTFMFLESWRFVPP